MTIKPIHYSFFEIIKELLASKTTWAITTLFMMFISILIAGIIIVFVKNHPPKHLSNSQFLFIIFTGGFIISLILGVFTSFLLIKSDITKIYSIHGNATITKITHENTENEHVYFKSNNNKTYYFINNDYFVDDKTESDFKKGSKIKINADKAFIQNNHKIILYTQYYREYTLVGTGGHGIRQKFKGFTKNPSGNLHQTWFGNQILNDLMKGSITITNK